MPDHVLQPREVCVASRRRTILPTDIINKFICTPAGKIEGRIRHNEVCFELRVTIVKECVRIKLAEVGFYTTNGKIHLSHLPCSRVGVLTKNRNLVDVAAVILNELCRLYKHTARAAARVINTSVERLQYLNESPHDTGRGIKFTGKLSFLLSKLREAIFVCTTKNILAVSMIDHLNVGEKINHFTKSPFIQLWTSKVLGKNIFETLVFFLNATHGIVDYRANFWRVRSSGNYTPSCIFRNKENVFSSIFILILLKSSSFIHKFLVFGLKTVRDIL